MLSQALRAFVNRGTASRLVFGGYHFVAVVNIHMTWTLVFILVTSGSEVSATALGRYSSMTDCFFARERHSYELTGVPDGHYPANTQAVCVLTDK